MNQTLLVDHFEGLLMSKIKDVMVRRLGNINLTPTFTFLMSSDFFNTVHSQCYPNITAGHMCSTLYSGTFVTTQQFCSFRPKSVKII